MLLWVGQAVSALGSNISLTAYPLLVLALTGSAASAGLVGFLGSLPYALLRLPAGALVDRWDRKRIMLVSDFLRAATLATLALAVLTGHAPLALVATAAFLEGSFSVFFNAADTGAIRHVVPASQLTAAMAQNEARGRGASLLGTPLGGALFGLGHAVPFFLDALTYLFSLLTLSAIRARFNDERTAPRQHLLREIKDGVAWLWRQPFLRTCVLLVAGSNFMFQGLFLGVVVLASDDGVSAGQIGVMLGGFGAGGLLGALAAPWLQARISPRLVVVGANWVWALLVPPILLVSHPYAVAVLLAGMAFVGPLWNVVIGSYKILLTPDALIGRISSVAGLISWGVIPFGSLIGGLAIDAFGAETTLLLLSLFMVAVAAAATVNRGIRQAPQLT